MDHPRIRGTNLEMAEDADEQAGSPPHTRDKYVRKLVELACCGITPAYAGQIGGFETQ